MYFIKKLIRKLLTVCNVNNRNVLFVRYFDEIKNVGDLLNVDLVQHYSKMKVINPVGISNKTKHYLCIGSIIHNMNSASCVIGSGLIDPKFVSEIDELGDIRAVRGKLTQKHLEAKFNTRLNVPLGDGGLLFPRIFYPHIKPIYELGIILHYVDENKGIIELIHDLNIKVISVKQEPRAFVSELLQCRNVLSSSMHGLILADAYNIPNKRIILGDDITGGDFKFKDYYSTTTNVNEDYIYLNQDVSRDDILNAYKLATVKSYTGDFDMLEEAFKNAFEH
jgi:pyruvyltransferase